MIRAPGGAAWLSEARLRRVWTALDGDAGRTRVVGGAVRDALLGEPIADIDLATEFTPPEVIERLARAEIASIPTGLAHGTITALVDHTPFEVTTLRRDIDTDGRHATVAFTSDWAEDAARRDFTLNALYVDPAGVILDPTGQGLDDLEARRVRFVGDPANRIAEDYLRVLRFFRFFARFGRGAIDSAGLAASAAAVGALHRLAVERVWSEMGKLLATADPRASLAAMAEAGVLSALFQTPSDLEVFNRLWALEDHAKPSRLARLVALIGEAAPPLAERWRMRTAETRHIAGILAVAALPLHNPWTALRRHGGSIVVDGLMVAAARGETRAMASVPLARAWTNPPLPITGADVLALGVAPGPDVGLLLAKVAAWWEEGGCVAGRAECLERLRGLTPSP